MAGSAYIDRRPMANGVRWRVRYRLGGRESRVLYGGTFKTKAEAKVRRDWIANELAAMRVPDLAFIEPDALSLPLLPEAIDNWRASRVDVEDQTRNMHRSSAARIFKVRRSFAADASIRSRPRM